MKTGMGTVVVVVAMCFVCGSGATEVERNAAGGEPESKDPTE